ncbi:MAG: NYN domain-containing protein [Verrucomicrobiales bacterium]|nr:NYN domain-containing protein [Verrucomicrobiales bacterium]
MKIYTYVDNSNLFIEGRRVSAVSKGMAPNIYDAMNHGILDHSWNVDYGKLHRFLCGTNKAEIGGAKLWGSLPPSDSFWDMVKRKGFDHTVFDKNFQGKEKKVDVAIAHGMTKDAYTVIDKKVDEITLVAGDKDFVPVVEDLVAEGFKVEVVFWDHAARELRDAATSFVSLNPHLTLLGR